MTTKQSFAWGWFCGGALILLLCLARGAWQPRYELQAGSHGIWRLDVQTGELSQLVGVDKGWRQVPYELGRPATPR